MANNLGNGCDSYRKVPIWKQFTTSHLSDLQSTLLWFLQESTNLKAIHNLWKMISPEWMAVIPTGKYQFESNSQPPWPRTPMSACCDSYRKVPIWKQFTTPGSPDCLHLCCDSYRKVPIWKQFTTSSSKNSPLTAVIPTGKYQFESNSQRLLCAVAAKASCDSYRKVPIWKQFTTSCAKLLRPLLLWFLQESTNLKAIHNFVSIEVYTNFAVIPTGKYQFESNSQPDFAIRWPKRCCDSYRKVPIWKQFTTRCPRWSRLRGCDSYRKVPIWKQFTTSKSEDLNQVLLWFLQESTNLKAIHNTLWYSMYRNLAVIPTGKYQFESNSQPYLSMLFEIVCCDSYRKVPIWKQFTTFGHNY